MAAELPLFPTEQIDRRLSATLFFATTIPHKIGHTIYTAMSSQNTASAATVAAGFSAVEMFQQFQRHIAQAVTELMKKVGGGHERELRLQQREVRAERACVRACAGVGAMAGLCGARFTSWGVLRTSVLRSRHAHAAQTARATARQLVQ